MKDFEKAIRELMKTNPNDQDLGKSVKAYINEFDINKEGEYIEVNGEKYKYIDELEFSSCKGCDLYDDNNGTCETSSPVVCRESSILKRVNQ